MKTITVLLACLLAAALLAGCGGGEDAPAWIERCRGAVADYVEGGGYLAFTQDTELVLTASEGVVRQRITAEGEIIFPARERYEYRETMSSSLRPGEEQENTFSYLTLDGGRTAYVKGEMLTTQLGVSGWVHYTPPEGQSRHFDYHGMMERLLSLGGGATWVGWEEVDGAACAHLSYGITGRDLMDLRLQENPSLAEQYQGLDPDEVLGDIVVEVWVGRDDRLPRRVMVTQSSTLGGMGSSSRIDMLFRAYGEEPPVPIEAPAVFTEAG